MRYIKNFLLLASLVSAPLLTGCASMGLGARDYGCKGYPEGRRCIPATEAYEMTDVDLPAIKDMIQEQQAGTYGATGGSATLGEPTGRPALTDVGRSIRASEQRMPVPHLDDGAVPIRTPSQTMRVWIAQWEDDRGNLQITGRIYTEIEPRRWVVGLPSKNVSPKLRLLQEIDKSKGDPRKRSDGEGSTAARR